jgi:L,D-transpeptidase catalytic domain
MKSTLRLIALTALVLGCVPSSGRCQLLIPQGYKSVFTTVKPYTKPDPNKKYTIVPRDVRIRDYFEFFDDLIPRIDTFQDFPMSEHLLVRHNPWLIERLAATDYYHQAKKGRFVFDQTEMVVLRKGDTLHIPTAAQAQLLLEKMQLTVIDVNIPEYTLRVFSAGDTMSVFKVRVGKSVERYLETAGRQIDLRTAVGRGEIVRIEKNAKWINPVDGHEYHATRRDDGRVTRCPRIPWLEPEIGRERMGQLIHPTTNPSTLGKAYSNGCIGLSEADAWRVYYFAPVGAKVKFRYDLDVMRPDGSIEQLEDIYGLAKKKVGDKTVLKTLEE